MCNYFYKQEMQDVRELSFSKSGLYQMELPCNNDDSTLDLKTSKIIFQNITYKISNSVLSILSTHLLTILYFVILALLVNGSLSSFVIRHEKSKLWIVDNKRNSLLEIDINSSGDRSSIAR